MAAITQHISIYQGDDFSLSLIIKDNEGNVVDVTGYSYLCQIRRKTTASTTLAELDVTATDAINGVVEISLNKTVTVDLPIPKTNQYWVWDLEVLTDAATPVSTTYYKGTVSVEADVSR